jgi:hypothetical protein
MRLTARWQRRLLRFVWSVPLAFAVVSAFAFTGVLNCLTDPVIPLPGGGGERGERLHTCYELDRGHRGLRGPLQGSAHKPRIR